MNLPDGRPLTLGEGVLPEPGRADGRVVLWLPGESAGGYRHWERVGSIPRAEISAGHGMLATPATSVPARQRLGGGLRNFFRRRVGSASERAWPLPGGGEAEQCGPRRADLMLAWPGDGTGVLDPGRIRARWPDCEGARAIGPDLYLVSGVGMARPPRAEPAEATGPGAGPGDSPRGLAERALAEAGRSGDPARRSIALADLGLASLQGRDARRGLELMEEALAEARRAGDPVQETNAMIDLGVAALDSGRPGRAREVLEAALARARAAGDRFAELAALDRLGQARMASGDHAESLGHSERALSLAADLGDGPREADLMWRIGLLHADLGRRDRAIVMAQASVDRMRRLGRPQAEWYAHHLALFRSGGHTTPPPGVSPPTEAVRGPGALRMALSSIGSMAKFLGSGFKASPAETYRDRLEDCAACEHHTGLRCRLCGCFTAAKARLLHERCPVARWRA